MLIGVPKENKKGEFRVGLSPHHAATYINNGHKVYIEKDAGIGSKFYDEDYIKTGCQIINTKEELYKLVDMIIKVKEPLEEEYHLMREGLIYFTYFHLAANNELIKQCLKNKIIAIAYETIENKDGSLPCLKPMSEIAGRLSIQIGINYLTKQNGGMGKLIGGIPGVKPAKILILGAGVVGKNACEIALGLHGDVTILDNSLTQLTNIDNLYHGKVKTLYCTEQAIIEEIKDADLIIGAALIPGATAPILIRKEHLKYMKEDTVIVDIAIDQGGCIETSKVTYFDNPIYKVDGVIHYCVGNLPSSVPCTSTLALNNATLPYGLKIANLGYKKACQEDAGLAKGLNTELGNLVCDAVKKTYEV